MQVRVTPLRDISFRVVAIFSACALALSGCCSATPPTRPNDVPEDESGLFYAVIKPFGKRSYYLGSDGQWAYFETCGEALVGPIYRKVQGTRVSLPKTFPLSHGKPYEVNPCVVALSASCAPVTK